MVKIKKYICELCLMLLLLSTISVWSQQDAQYTQYMYNTASVNPGYAGSRGNLSVALLHRSQWVGIEGAPRTQTFNFHTPVGYRGVGLGFSIINDKIGPTSETNFDGDFSYTINVSQEARLSFGLKVSAHLMDIRYSELNQDNGINGIGIDPILQNDIDNKFSPNIGAGVYYRNENFYIGLSVPQLLETKHFAVSESSLSTAKENINYYLITGYVFNINPFLKFKPALLTKAVSGAPLQVDLSANFMFNNKFILGAAYRLDAALSGLVGFQVSDGFMVGLAYDKDTTAFGGLSFNGGSFEVMLRYDFIKTRSKLKTPRFF